jgi:hypothetical protein
MAWLTDPLAARVDDGRGQPRRVASARGVITSRSVLTLPGTTTAIDPPQAHRRRVGPSVSAPG